MYLISLIGWSGSGKWYLAGKIIAAVGADKVSTIPMDMYYYPDELFPKNLYVDFQGETFKNFDTPEAFDRDLLVEHIKILKSGQSVQIPSYDFGKNPTGKAKRTTGAIIEPKDFIIINGLFPLCDERIRAMSDVSIFIDISPVNRMARRLIRDWWNWPTRSDMGKPGIGDDILFYVQFVENGYQNYVEPCKKYASIVVNNDIWLTPNEEPKMVDITVNYLKWKYEKQIEDIL